MEDQLVTQAKCFTAEREQRHHDDLYAELNRPFMHLKPRMALDGNKWICCYGDNIQEGVVGIGDSPDLASRDFDRAWYTKRS